MLAQVSTGKEFLVLFNIDNCLERYSLCKTPLEALQLKKIKIREIAACYGEKTILLWFQTWIIKLSEFKDFEVSEDQAKKTAMFLLEDIYMLNMAELTLLFKRIMKGHYGDFYGKFDGTVIIQAARNYRKERGRILSKMSDQEYNQLFNQ